MDPTVQRRVLVLGGAGFVGRHAVASLLASGAEVIVGSRQPGDIDLRLPAQAQSCARRLVKLETLVKPRAWEDLLADVDVVLNCVGILRERGTSTYTAVHQHAPRTLAGDCAALNRRLVHVSALGLHEGARSGFLTSKLAGEVAIKDSTADWIIVRPSLLDGEGGFGARWLRGVARLPVFFAPMDARGRIAALDVADLGDALAQLCLGDSEVLGLGTSREFELGGEQEFEFRDYIRALRKNYSANQAWCIPIPGLLARLGAHICDLLHFTPFSFGHWELLRRNNVPRDNRLPDLIGRAPKRVAGSG